MKSLWVGESDHSLLTAPLLGTVAYSGVFVADNVASPKD
jgi:hypothetical protein